MERRGAPILAFTRISDKNIRIKHEIYNPDCVVILDSTLLDDIDVTKGLKPGGLILINTDKNLSTYTFKGDFKVAAVDAAHIAARYGIGTKSPNSAVIVLKLTCKSLMPCIPGHSSGGFADLSDIGLIKGFTCKTTYCSH